MFEELKKNLEYHAHMAIRSAKGATNDMTTSAHVHSVVAIGYAMLALAQAVKESKPTNAEQ